MLDQSPYEEAIVSHECVQLAHSLGIVHYPQDDKMKPFMRYVALTCKAGHLQLAFFSLFRRIVQHFGQETNQGAVKNMIQTYITALVKSDAESYLETTAGSREREQEATEVVFQCLGLWTLMKSNFVSPNSPPPIRLAYLAQKQALTSQASIEAPIDVFLKDVITQSGLVPSKEDVKHDFDALQKAIKEPDSDPNAQFPVEAIESLCIRSQALNLSKLCTLAGVQIHWTNNISRHLLLSQRAGFWLVEIYALPCTLEDGYMRKLDAVGVPSHYLSEVRQSYANLFNPVTPPAIHRMFDWFLKTVCWCLHCSSRRLKKQQFKAIRSSPDLFYDPVIDDLSSAEAESWDHVSFPHLWARILRLESHLQNAKPWNFWVLFRDRRDKMPFWTFL